MAIPRAFRWTSTPLMLLAMAACQKNPSSSSTSSTPSTPQQQAASKKIISAEPTSFDAIARHLDPGGGFYFFLSTENFLKAASTKLAQLQPLLLGSMPSENRAKATEAWDYASRIASQSGLNEISGFGISSIAVEPGYYQTKWMLHHYEGNGNGVLWKLNGNASDALEIISYLPERTALASSGDFSLQPVWNLLNKEAATKPELRQGIDLFARQLEANAGLKLVDLIASVGPRYAVVVTLDESRQATLPSAPGRKPLTVPEPGLAILIQVKDPALLGRVEQELAKIPGIVIADDGDLKLRSIPVPVPLPFLRPAVAWQKDTLVLSSNEALIREMFEVKAGKKPGLAASENFKKLTADLPAPACQFQVIAPIFQKTLLDIQIAAAQQPNTPPEAQRFLEFFASSSAANWACSVVQDTPEGWIGFSRGATGPTQIAGIGSVAPAAILAGIATPAFISVRERGKQTKSLSRAKQIYLGCRLYAGDHDGNFPATLDELVPQYLPNKSILTDPMAPDAEGVGYHYFGGKDTDAPNKVLLVSKAAGKNNTRVVITCDGAGRIKPATENGL